ncbi:hypothetical protein ACFVQ9_36645 [Streptomyces goshikiensis]|uniref:hypothetical protein n=1 Tax=Streptomyces goshikiensis TaxID=1942 RepID=UPI0036ACC0CB
MGRRKPGKPRRERIQTYTLQQLQPPGYDEWLNIGSDFTADAAAADSRLSEESVDLMRRFARLQPLYRGLIPMRAVQLDMALDQGAIPISRGDDETGALIPMEEIAALMGADSSGHDVRESLHRLHSVGGFLVEEAADGVPVIRMVSQPPQRPGDPWIFHGTAEDALVPSTCIPARPGDLPSDEFAALTFIRTHMSRGTEALPEEFAKHDGIDSVGRARQLFEAVAELAQAKGCGTCPSAHLCTRVDEAR